MRSAAALHGRYLLRVREVGDIEDAHSAETIGTGRRGTPSAASGPRGCGRIGRQRFRRRRRGGNEDALRAAIDASVHGLGRHEEQVAVHRHIALSPGTDQRRAELDLHRVIDVVEVDPVIVAHEEMVAAEG